MSGARALMVLNGKQAGDEATRAAVQAWRERGRELAVRVTWEPGDAERIVDEALAAGCQRIVAAGGDGTLGEVAGVLARRGRRASLVALPLGTANDFARAAGIPDDPLEALALMDDEPVDIDLGRLGARYFLNMATGGFGSRVTASTSEELKRFLGGGAYLITGLSRFAEVRALRGQFRGPGFEWEGEFLAFGVGNGRQAGGGQVLCPRARVDDGLLDLCIVPAPADAVGTLGTLLAGGLQGIEAVSVGARLPWLEVSAGEPLDVNLDGEPWAGEPLRFEIEAGRLRLHLPADSPLLHDAGEALEKQA